MDRAFNLEIGQVDIRTHPCCYIDRPIRIIRKRDQERGNNHHGNRLYWLVSADRLICGLRKQAEISKATPQAQVAGYTLVFTPGPHRK